MSLCFGKYRFVVFQRFHILRHLTKQRKMKTSIAFILTATIFVLFTLMGSTHCQGADGTGVFPDKAPDNKAWDEGHQPGVENTRGGPLHWSVTPHGADPVYQQGSRDPFIRRSQLSQPACFRTIEPADRYGGTSSRGTDFWVLFMRNLDGANVNLYLDITSEFHASGEVSIPGLGFSQSFTVAANTVTRVDLPSNAQIMDHNTIESIGVRVVSDLPVSIYGMNQQTNSTDGFLALPVSILGTQYMVMTYPGLSWHDSAPSILSLPQYAILSPYDNNLVTITPSDETLDGQPAGQSYQVTLNAGEAYMVRGRLSAEYAADQTGSIISSTLPVAVFNGNSCTSVPIDVPACDHLVEQAPPLSTWGSTFIARPLESRQGGDTWRFLSSQNNTTLHINGELVATLGFADFYETMLTEPSVIEASNPIMAVQFANSQNWDNVPSDPFMMTIPPFQQFLDAYTFSTPSSGFMGNYYTATLLTAGIHSHLQDGEPINPAAFEQVQDSDFSTAGISIGVNVSHHIHNELNIPSGLYVYGFNDYDSYGYAGGLSLVNINPESDPQIALHTETLTYFCDSIPSEQDLEIAAWITVIDDPPVEGAMLYYRSIGEVNYVPLEMADQGGNLWSALIPAAEVVFPGLEFYIVATDGQLTSSSPSVNPQQFPHSVSVDNMPPEIVHEAVESSIMGEAIAIEAVVTDDTDYVESVTLFYRIRGGTPVYILQEMDLVTDDHYEALIPSGVMTMQGVEYYIKATDNHGSSCTFGSADEPLYIWPETVLVVATAPPANVESTSAILGGYIISPGALPIMDKGIVYGVDENLPEEGESISMGSGMAPFSSLVTNLEPHTEYFVVAYASDDEETAYGEILSFTTPGPPPEVMTADADQVTSTSAEVGGEATYGGDDGIVERGVFFGENPNPVGYGQQVMIGSGTGVFSTILADLSKNTQYYFAAFASSSVTTVYGEVKAFHTPADPPDVSTSVPWEITATSAMTGGTVTDDGGMTVSSKGVLWGEEPDLVDSGHEVIHGMGTGEFDLGLHQLIPGTTYYVMAFAENLVGRGFGEVESFTTLDMLQKIPNAFMPNSTIEANRVFRPLFNLTPETYSMSITNNWGSVLFETKQADEGWDGWINGSEASAGGYVFHIRYTDYKGQQHDHHGVLMLVR